ncbi:hypothetical protein GFK26_18480 [Variovorax paradoxus]|uniref:Portal protein n=1 Tax=Variovorax paradoxus TaxID=34073 RepID=A0A5Q0M7P9_VARPD|nr:hypothetical protein [Variovorax paradoxus]QFZ84614.1 hypothetical protein GFK26_18480 [Variovorax paradoxus]
MSKDPLLELIKRRHPRYDEKLAHWNFLDTTYEGGRSWFAENIFRFIKEGDLEYAGRVERAYRFNHTKQVVDLVDKYLFKMDIARKTADAPPSVQKFWSDATLAGLDMDELSKRISTATSKFGRIYIVIDSNATAETAPRTKADEKKSASRIYAYIVTPQDMLDMSYDELGVLNWCLIKENHRDDADPLNSTGKFLNRYRLWGRNSWVLYEERKEKGKTKVVEIDRGEVAIGCVPVIEADHNFCEDQFAAPGLIDDVAYLDRANANYLSNLDAIIQDQTFSQLTIPAQALVAGDGEDAAGKLAELGTKRIFTYNGEGGKSPEFISPDPTQAGMILDAISKIVGEIYHSVGLQAERTGSNSGGGQGEASGVSKAYDFEKINSLLASKAAALELTERKILKLVALYAGEEGALKDDLVTYPIDFDVRGIYDEFEIAARLSLLAAPDEVRREQMRAVIKKLFPGGGKKLMEKLEASLKAWPPKIEPGLGAPATPGGKKDPVKAAATQKTAKELAA